MGIVFVAFARRIMLRAETTTKPAYHQNASQPAASSQRWKKSDAGGYPEEKGAAGYMQLAAFFFRPKNAGETRGRKSIVSNYRATKTGISVSGRGAKFGRMENNS